MIGLADDENDDVALGSDGKKGVRPKYLVFPESRNSVARARATRSDRR